MEEYEEIRKIGKGSYGDVYLCKHTKTNKEVADKRIEMNFLKDDEQKMVNEEAKILDMCSRSSHPNVVVFIGCREVGSVFHFYMEYCSGGSLEVELNGRSKQAQHYEEIQILRYVYQIASGLAFIHEKKVIHRDLKPANILKSSEGTLKIADFGVGAALTRTGSMRKTKKGTHAYMAPEVVQENEYTCKCDMWSFGVTAYEMITFRLPFSAKNDLAMTMKIIKEPFDPIEKDISHELKTLLADTMSKDPSARPNSQEILSRDFLKQQSVRNVEADCMDEEEPKSNVLNHFPEHKPVSNESLATKKIDRQPPARTRGVLYYCDSHGTGSGCYSSDCGKIHTCAHFVLGEDCARGRKQCKFGHDFNTEHNHQVLLSAGYSPYESNEIRAELIRNRSSSIKLDSFYDD